MTGQLTGPAWYWLAGTVALVVCAWAFLAAAGLAAAALLPRRRGRRKLPARVTPPPAPGHHPHRAGQLLKRVYIYRCGRTVIYDQATRTRRVVGCACPSADWDQELKDLTR